MRSNRSLFVCALIGAFLSAAVTSAAGATVEQVVSATGPRGLVVVLDDPSCELAVKLARSSELLVYAQVPSASDVEPARRAVDAAGLLGVRVYVEAPSAGRIGLADNLADAVVAPAGRVQEAEALRVLRPGGKAFLGDEALAKPAPAGVDDWSHPYHGPDNNPLSADRVARAPFRTQFLAEPWYGPLPQVTVAAGGRIFRLFGHIASKPREWPQLNALVVSNASNGTILWRRDLTAGFMIHRNTVVATAETLYLADSASCKLIDAATGNIRGQIVPPAGLTAERCWKWLALSGGVLYAMVGPDEPAEAVLRARYPKHGWSWGGIGPGYARSKQNPQSYPWGFGRTVLAIDPATRKVLWHHTDEQPIDGRAICMSGGRIYYYCPGKRLVCLDAKSGKVAWKTDDDALLEAIGPHTPAQGYMTGFSSTAYLKCSGKALYFAGPQRKRLVAVSADDGKMLWQDGGGNVHLVLYPGGVYTVGQDSPSRKFDPLSGRVLQTYGFRRNGCARATGSVDGVFLRGGPGTAWLGVADDQLHRITPMRPPCMDGVVFAGGLAHWGPWMCDCNLSLVGAIALAPAGQDKPREKAARLETFAPANAGPPPALTVADADWPTFRRDNARSAGAPAAVPVKARQLWRFVPEAGAVPTAPVSAGGMVFVADSAGVVRAIDGQTGRQAWKAYTGGAVLFPPSVSGGRLYVGSADGWVYCLAAATGERLWRFRAAPAERRIPVYGRLSSTWPAASGVLVEGGTAYVAAGIANYDGTHIYALDATTGAVKWHNDETGRAGVNVVGHLLLHEGRLYLAGGSTVSPAAFDAATGRPVELARIKGGHYELYRGRNLYLAGRKVTSSGHILYAPAVDLDAVQAWAVGTVRAFNGQAVVATRRGKGGESIVRLAANDDGSGKAAPAWQAQVFDKTTGIAVCANAAVVLGLDAADHDRAPAGVWTSYGVAAVDFAGERVLWKLLLPSPAVPWGLAVDAKGRVIVSLRDGTVICLGG